MSTYTDYGYNNLLSVSGNSAISSNTSETTTANASSSTINTSNVDSAIDSGTISIDKTTINKLLVGQYIKSSNYVTGVSGWIIDGSGNVEFSSGTFRGNIAAATGTIGGWTIGANELYATTTGVLKTAATVGVGSNGVILDKDGLRVYDSVLGQVVNLPSNGDVPSFSSGTINETTFEISTNSILRTSTTVGDGSASSAGVLINNTGIYGCGASQTPTTANVKILNDGTAEFKGAISGSTIDIGGADTSSFHVDVNGNMWSGAATFDDATFKVDNAGNVTANSLCRSDFHVFLPFEEVVGYTKSIDADGSITASGGCLLATGATNGNITTIYKYLVNIAGSFSWEKKSSVKTIIRPIDVTDSRAFIACGRVTFAAPETRHIGFYIEETTLYGTTGNGTSQSLVSIGTVTAGGFYYLEYVCDLSSVKFYLNGVYIDQITTNIPISSTSGAGNIFNATIKTTADDPTGLQICWYDFWQAN